MPPTGRPHRTLRTSPTARRCATNWSPTSCCFVELSALHWGDIIHNTRLRFSSLMPYTPPMKTEPVHPLSKAFSCSSRAYSESQSHSSVTHLLCSPGPQTFTTVMGLKTWKQDQPIRYLSHVKIKMKYVHWMPDTHPSTQTFHYLIL